MGTANMASTVSMEGILKNKDKIAVQFYMTRLRRSTLSNLEVMIMHNQGCARRADCDFLFALSAKRKKENKSLRPPRLEREKRAGGENRTKNIIAGITGRLNPAP